MTEEEREKLMEAAYQFGSDLREAFERLAEALQPMAHSLEEFAKEIEKVQELPAPPEEIKRRIKYAKNPMEIRELNKQLQASYKAYGRSRKR